MAETQEASTGYNGEVHINDGTDLYELVGVQGFGLPQNRRERVDASTLKDLRPKTIPGRYESSEFTVTVLYRPQSDTDALLHELNESSEERAMKIAVPEQDGTLAEEWSFTGEVTGYEVDDLDAGAAMTATVTIEVQSAITRAPVVV